MAFCLGSALAGAAEPNWQSYRIAETGAAVQIPVDIFSESAALPDGGLGRRFFTGDRRADLTLQSLPNPDNDSPARFLEKMRPPPGIVYKRVTRDFFVVSSVRSGRIWYDRCNRSGRTMTCVLINYPASEKKQWDAIVTRISHTLTS